MATAARLPNQEPQLVPEIAPPSHIGEQLPLRLIMLVERIDRHQSNIQAELKHIRDNLPQQRRPLSRRTQELHIRVIAGRRNGRCPCCQHTPVCSEIGRLDGAEFDRFYGRNQNRATQSWLVCGECNAALNNSEFKAAARSAFESYQAALKPFLAGRQISLGLTG